MFKKLFMFLILLVLSFSEFVLPEILYKISGKVVYNGNGVPGCLIRLVKTQSEMYKEYKTTESGSFHFFVPNGIYKLVPDEYKNLISKEPLKFIIVKEKNVKNIIIFMEMGCFIEGYVKFEDGSPSRGSIVIFHNLRSGNSDETDINGFYKVGPIRASEETFVKIWPAGASTIQPDSHLALSEGSIVQNYNFTVPQKLSLTGKVVDKTTGESIEGINVNLLRPDSRLQSTIKSFESGEIKFYNIPEGKYWMNAIDLNGKYGIEGFYIQVYSNKVNNFLIELEKEE